MDLYPTCIIYAERYRADFYKFLWQTQLFQKLESQNWWEFARNSAILLAPAVVLIF